VAAALFRNNMKNIIITTLIGLLLVAIIGLLTERACFVMRLNAQTTQLEADIYWRGLHYRDCICIRKTHIVSNLQRYYNNLGNSRYFCGKEDNQIGPLFKTATYNYMFDQMAGQYFTMGIEK